MTRQEHEKLTKEFDDAYRDLFKMFKHNHQQDPHYNTTKEILKFSWMHEFLVCKWERATGLIAAYHPEEFEKWCKVIENKKEKKS